MADSDDKDDDARIPKVGAGSAAWFHKLVKSQVAASAIGGFIGSLMGKFIRRGPTFSWGDNGSLIVQSTDGISLVLDSDAVMSLRRTLIGPPAWYHLHASNDDLPI